MSALHEAVARAAHGAACCTEPGAWDVPRWHRASNAAVRVCLAEARRAVDTNRNDAYRAAYETLPHSEGFDWDRDAGLLAQAGTRREIERGVDAALDVVLAVIAAMDKDAVSCEHREPDKDEA